MGIRFYCPNGHKLNVKTFQAGNRGYCPHCGASILIPLESVRPSTHQPSEPSENAASATFEGALASPDAAPQVTVELDLVNDDAQETIATPTIDPGNLAPAAAVTTIDPILEAPEAVWYVRTAGGGQFGPAAGSVMRSWLEEGRVAADSLLWREGWPEWRLAVEPFPYLRNGGGPPSIEIRPPAALRASEPKKLGRRLVRVAIVVGLLITIMIAAGVLLWIML